MCKLTKNIKKKSVVGYKLVIKNKETGKYFSAAMGCKYEEDEDIPKVETQQPIGCFWADNILVWNFKKNMTGRTSCFKYLKDIKRALSLDNCINVRNFIFVLVKVQVSKDLMEGEYNTYWPVYAGRRIKFLKEIIEY